MKKRSCCLGHSSVSRMTFEEANDHVNYWVGKTEDERLNAACFIINQIFKVTPYTQVDKTIITRRKQPNCGSVQ